MKIPGIGEVSKNEAIWLGILAAGVAGFTVYKYRKAKGTTTNAQTLATGTSDYVNGNGVDPTTGLPYDEESSAYYGYGGVDPSTGMPYVYESGSTSSASQYTSNVQWANAAITEAETLGIDPSVAQSAISAYLQNLPTGLPASQYTIMQEILALVGPPPQGTFSLSEQPALPTGGTTSTGTGSVGTFSPQVPTGDQGITQPITTKVGGVKALPSGNVLT